MYYTYILKSQKTGRYYIGYTNNLQQRIAKHNQGHSTATKSGVPWQLLWVQGFKVKRDAIKLEKALKRFKNKAIIESIVDGTYSIKGLF
jgi:putative endonuclease